MESRLRWCLPFRQSRAEVAVESHRLSSKHRHRLHPQQLPTQGQSPIRSRAPHLLTDLSPSGYSCSELLPGRSLACIGDLSLGSALETFASLKKIYIAIRCPKWLLLHSFKAYLSCCLLALQDCFCRGLHSVLLGGQCAVGLPVHLRRPPRADARDALAILDPIFMLLRMEEYITFSAIEPFTDPTGW